MNGFTKISLRVSLLLAVCFALPHGAAGTVDDAQSFALQAAEPYVKEGFQVREDYWGGDLGSGEKKAVRQQLFKGNEYWFWLGTEVERAKVSVHIYDSEGKLAEQPDSWEKVTSRPRMSSPKRPAVISPLSRSKSRPKNGRTGHWFTVSVNPQLLMFEVVDL